MCEELSSVDFVGNFYQVHDKKRYLELCSKLTNDNIFPVQRLIINGAVKDFHHTGIPYDGQDMLSVMDCLSLGPYKYVFIDSTFDTKKIIEINKGKRCNNMESIIDYLQFIADIYNATDSSDTFTINANTIAKLFIKMSINMVDDPIPTVTSIMERPSATQSYYMSELHSYGMPENKINDVRLLLGFSKN